jgi:hypothetical protein
MRQKPRLTAGTCRTLPGPTVSKKAIVHHSARLKRRAIFWRAPMGPRCPDGEREA